MYICTYHSDRVRKISLLYALLLYRIVCYCIVCYCIVSHCIALYCIVLYCIFVRSKNLISNLYRPFKKRYQLEVTICKINHHIRTIFNPLASLRRFRLFVVVFYFFPLLYTYIVL